MKQRQEYTWDELVGSSECIEVWQPQAIPDPYKLPGFYPEAVPPYGDPLSSPADMAAEQLQTEMNKTRVRMLIGEAALWQLYADDELYSTPVMARQKRIASNMTLLRFLERDMYNAESPGSVQILPWKTPVSPNGLVPFTIYTRKAGLQEVIAVQIDRRVHYSTDPELIERKRKALWDMRISAKDGIDTHQIIAEAIKEQARELK